MRSAGEMQAHVATRRRVPVQQLGARDVRSIAECDRHGPGEHVVRDR
jgi:hypothetical protein